MRYLSAFTSSDVISTPGYLVTFELIFSPPDGAWASSLQRPPELYEEGHRVGVLQRTRVVDLRRVSPEEDPPHRHLQLLSVERPRYLVHLDYLVGDHLR